MPPQVQRHDDADMTAAGSPTVVIADDDSRVREALGALIVAHPGLVLVGSAETGFEAATLCERLRPNVAVVDVMMPGGGREAILAIGASSPTTSVVVYTARSDRRTRERMLEVGAVAVLVKGGGGDLAAAIEQAATQRAALQPEVTTDDG